jgi:hypothetical protein
MVRGKQNATVQLNLRVTPQLFRELETQAKAHGITVSEEVRRKLEVDLSLANYLNTFEHEMRDAIEHKARGSRDPEPAFHRLATFGAEIRGFYTRVEKTLLPDMTDSKVRELMRGGK